MNEDTRLFIEELKADPRVQGVILFGSWARGNNRPDSDVDLVVILTEGYRRTVEYKNSQAFEIIYITEEGALEYWENHKDDAAGLWQVAKVLYDKDGTINRLQLNIQKVLDEGKKPVDNHRLGQCRFDAEDLLRYSESILETDPITANLILSNKVFSLTELLFDIRQEWTPAPKQLLAIIREVRPDLHGLIVRFYQDGATLREKLGIAKEIIPLIFGK